MWIESFNLVLDANRDGTVSLVEAWQIFEWLYLLPGNLLLELLGSIPPIADLLHIRASPETGYGSLNGVMATALSLLIWLLLLVEAANLRERWKSQQMRRHKLAHHFRHPQGKA
ncbi:MAG TPA: hypothetical protein VKZ66_10140 [Pusillimonas sp.]|uniref:hypothetical protein n=1 Tax=unclassified Pusillimonas TaxID=2640016 RepID=UPI0026339B72|nr:MULTISPECIES: hypothetical protein [unclassified Pusillimonas]HLU20306.1 hypothetical protein [Pusillimonas sp.]